MQAIHDVVKAGYVRYIGMSSCWAYQCEFLVRLQGVILLSHLLRYLSPCHAEYVPIKRITQYGESTA